MREDEIFVDVLLFGFVFSYVAGRWGGWGVDVIVLVFMMSLLVLIFFIYFFLS